MHQFKQKIRENLRAIKKGNFQSSKLNLLFGMGVHSALKSCKNVNFPIFNALQFHTFKKRNYFKTFFQFNRRSQIEI